MKCCDITSGMLSALVALQRRTATPDGQGGYTEAWAADPVGGVWAMARAISGSERWMADRVTPANRFRFIVRFRADGNGAPYYNIGDRVVYKGRTYGITAVTDVEDMHRYLEILAEENKAT